MKRIHKPDPVTWERRGKEWVASITVTLSPRMTVTTEDGQPPKLDVITDIELSLKALGKCVEKQVEFVLSEFSKAAAANGIESV